jgi:NAD(P)-dependent dehydrogenase (short-subunit alcohol dehydrogenase family)
MSGMDVDAAPVVLITGASSGIGRASALAFADRGARLVLASRSADGLDEAAAQCRARGATALVHPVDVTDEVAVQALVDIAVATFGRLDVVVCSAGVVAYGRFEEVPTEIFDAVVRTNALGTANVARAALRALRAQRHGTLVLVGSLLGRVATPYLGSYVVSKWAVHGLARVLAIENRDLADVHVCLVTPGGVDTPIYRQAANYAGRQGQPPPPVVSPERVAGAVLDVVDRPRREVSVGPGNAVTVLGSSLLPGVYDWLVGPLMRRLGLSRRAVAPTTGNVFQPVPQRERTRA